MTEFEAIITSYKQVNAQYTVLKCANAQMILTPYINYTMVMTFYDEKILNVKLEHMLLKEATTMLTKIGWEVCA